MTEKLEADVGDGRCSHIESERKADVFFESSCKAPQKKQTEKQHEQFWREVFKGVEKLQVSY